jgi:HEPN domain-containing protein
MNDFSKIKIPFSLALLAAMFAISPLIQKYGDVSYILFGMTITLNFIYLLFCISLGASVYFYAIGLVGDRPLFDLINKVGHIVYALALIVPPLFLILYPVSMITDFLISAFRSTLFSKIVEYGGSVAIGAAATFIGNLIFRAFASRDRKEKIDRLSVQENHLLSRARQLFQQGYYDLAATKSWKAVEVALNKTFETAGVRTRGQTINALLDLARKRELLNSREIEELMRVRQIRNTAVHTERRVTKEEAESVLDVSDKIIAALDKVTDRCYFCGNLFPLSSLESDDATGASVCKACAKKNPDWKDTLVAMGMDP